MVSNQVEGQMTLDEYEAWREVPAMGEMTDDAVAAADREEASYKDRADYLAAQEMPEVIVAEERALVTLPISQQHLMVGLGALAAMDETEFNQKLEMLRRGQERLEIIVKNLLTIGIDYGRVPGITKPFLQLPGAEKLHNFYGYAVRHEVERIVGEREVIVASDGTQVMTEKWLSAPLAFHAKSYVHLGDFDGPIVAMGYGEANAWEPKYRYIFAKATCPKCGREGLIRGKADGKLKGKWWCPSREGGCNSTFEPAATKEDGSPLVALPGKIENPDPSGMAETLIQIAVKRSFVASVRRATGTSGYFTQDEDSPSVQAQSDQAPPDADEAPVVTAVAAGTTVSRGGKADAPTKLQLNLLGKASKEKDLGPQGLAAVIERVTQLAPVLSGDDRPAQGRSLLAWITANLTADQLGEILHTLNTGEVDTAAPASVAGGN